MKMTRFIFILVSFAACAPGCQKRPDAPHNNDNNVIQYTNLLDEMNWDGKSNKGDGDYRVIPLN